MSDDPTTVELADMAPADRDRLVADVVAHLGERGYQVSHPGTVQTHATQQGRPMGTAAELSRVRAAYGELDRHTEVTLAPALGYPPYPPGSPGHSPDQVNYVTGDHVAESLISEAANLLKRRAAALDGIGRLHVASHGYCVVCDDGRDVDTLGNNPDCPHQRTRQRSFCRECDRAFPCRTRRVLDGDLEAATL